MNGEHANDPTFAARFQREAKAASRLNHPNSIQVLDFGAEPDGLLYIAMEYLDGRSLHHVLRDEWPLAPARVADILMQTLAALAVAHDMGVVHRDLKPENMMILSGTDDDGRPKDIVKVCDFGIAKITDPRAYRGHGERDSEGPVTTAGFLVGTPEYMSPEQGRGEKLDPRSDLYSVGVILFEMLTRRVPFEAENAIGVVLKHITEEPPKPSRLVRRRRPSPRRDHAPCAAEVPRRALPERPRDARRAARRGGHATLASTPGSRRRRRRACPWRSGTRRRSRCRCPPTCSRSRPREASPRSRERPPSSRGRPPAVVSCSWSVWWSPRWPWAPPGRRSCSTGRLARRTRRRPRRRRPPWRALRRSPPADRPRRSTRRP